MCEVSQGETKEDFSRRQQKQQNALPTKRATPKFASAVAVSQNGIDIGD